ncbi:recombinase family protein [Staphylococcus cohnii]|uniref:recombinase family protein n=1 Tax=Staphylococcus cohnii TaxID=29382 RepID=UPI003D7E8CF5
MRKIGYARVAYPDQNLDTQLTKLLINGCDLVYSEQVNVYYKEQLELEHCLDELKADDTLVIEKLKVLGFTPKKLMEFFESRILPYDIHLEVLDLGINTNTEEGQSFIEVFKKLSESENILLKERTTNGLEAAKERGRYGGRPQLSEDKRKYIKQLYASRTYTPNEISKMVGVSRTTVYRIVKK